MALEDIEGTGKYISDLDSNNPLNTDRPGADGDNHIRGIKNTIKNTFPSISGPVTATHGELNILDGVTSTAAELNILDGVTATTTEINYLSGVTSDIQTQLDKKKTTVKSLDEVVNNSNTLQDDNELSISVGVNSKYKLTALIAYTSSSPADIKLAFSVPTGTVGKFAQTNELGTFSPVSLTTSVIEAGAGTAEKFTRLFGYIITSTTSGNITLQWAQNTAEVSDTTILAGSWMTIEQ